MRDVLNALDAWCQKRATEISRKAGEHIMSGRSLEAAGYRTLLGEHRAYMAMRSYIHGTLNAQGIEARSDETPQAAQPERREPDGEADAPNPTSGKE